jgi:hypothetical protein
MEKWWKLWKVGSNWWKKITGDVVGGILSQYLSLSLSLFLSVPLGLCPSWPPRAEQLFCAGCFLCVLNVLNILPHHCPRASRSWTETCLASMKSWVQTPALRRRGRRRRRRRRNRRRRKRREASREETESPWVVGAISTVLRTEQVRNIVPQTRSLDLYHMALR